ncbi:hypothetical protein QA641_15480 [Bradyrhizobium sp. CB1650]|uniref:hypothetical protein n=1 Tax=Bradyrhizobium sp. CB1650 TaxID=3039153 RepID=UPI002435DF93|nr:hypothetical protein [Bradyrhizobium sp. CB1650]WGD55157.1 hypothetical protein QA641_15480 [Bradyrhizobium sp. CB1650]
MLLHLPVAVLTTLLPIPVSDQVPKFDIAKECRFEGGSSFEQCSHDETEALQKLQAEWPQFAGVDKSACLAESTVAGFTSYVELIICLEMARDVRKADANGSPAGQVRPPAQPDMSAVDKRD